MEPQPTLLRSQIWASMFSPAASATMLAAFCSRLMGSVARASIWVYKCAILLYPPTESPFSLSPALSLSPARSLSLLLLVFCFCYFFPIFHMLKQLIFLHKFHLMYTYLCMLYIYIYIYNSAQLPFFFHVLLLVKKIRAAFLSPNLIVDRVGSPPRTLSSNLGPSESHFNVRNVSRTLSAEPWVNEEPRHISAPLDPLRCHDYVMQCYSSIP